MRAKASAASPKTRSEKCFEQGKAARPCGGNKKLPGEIIQGGTTERKLGEGDGGAIPNNGPREGAS